MGEGAKNEPLRKRPSRNSGTPPWEGNERRGTDGDNMRSRNKGKDLPPYSEALLRQIEQRNAAEKLKLGIGKPNLDRVTTGGSEDGDKEH